MTAIISLLQVVIVGFFIRATIHEICRTMIKINRENLNALKEPDEKKPIEFVDIDGKKIK